LGDLLDEEIDISPISSSERSLKDPLLLSPMSQIALTNIAHPHLTTKLNNHYIPTNCLTIYQTSIHSLQDKYDLLNTHIQLLSNPPSIITITDNMLPEHINQTSYPIQQYKHKHIPGISVYYQTNYHISILPNPNPIQDSNHIIIQIHANEQLNNPIHTIINIYHRPRKLIAQIEQFIQDLQSTVNKIQSKSHTTEITIVGDININLLNLTPAHQFHYFLIENNLHTTITTPTRYDPIHNTHTLIDTILTTMIQNETTAGTISPPLSDHLPIYTTFHNPTPQKIEKSHNTLSTIRYEQHKE
jgi:exonuclease III